MGRDKSYQTFSIRLKFTTKINSVRSLSAYHIIKTTTCDSLCTLRFEWKQKITQFNFCQIAITISSLFSQEHIFGYIITHCKDSSEKVLMKILDILKKYVREKRKKDFPFFMKVT